MQGSIGTFTLRTRAFEVRILQIDPANDVPQSPVLEGRAHDMGNTFPVVIVGQTVMEAQRTQVRLDGRKADVGTFQNLRFKHRVGDFQP
ncbi:hypothetical protein D3C84_540620 [compost metagenome]